MKKAILLCGMLLAMTATLASAAPGVSLRWTNCFAEGGAFNRNSLCNSNTLNNDMMGSFELAQPMLQVSSTEPVVDLATASPALPAWFSFNGCRQGGLTIAQWDLGTDCPDWAESVGTVLGGYEAPSGGPNAARIKMVSAVAVTKSLGTGVEYAAFRVRISNANTLTCQGCLVPACIVFNSIRVYNSPPGQPSTFVDLAGPTNGTDSHFITWQGGAGVTVPGRGDACPASTPARNATWGQVKSLYR
jgi:hypothetical protein